MLAINYEIFKSIGKLNKGVSDKLKKYNLHIWIGIIAVLAFITLDFSMPNEKITPSEIAFIIIFLLPFMLTSGYKPERNLRGYLRFCLVFPIGEELLFRGIILALATYIVGEYRIYVPIPILKGVSLQVFITAIAFGITHYQYFKPFTILKGTMGRKIIFHKGITKKVIYAFAFGLFAGNIVEITGSILYPILFHIIANTGATLNYINKEKNRAVTF